MAKINIWGCIKDFKTSNELNPYSFNAKLGVETYRTVREIETLKTERIILLNIQVEDVNPIWIIISREEAKELSNWLKEVVEAFDKDVDYERGRVPHSLFFTSNGAGSEPQCMKGQTKPRQK